MPRAVRIKEGVGHDHVIIFDEDGSESGALTVPPGRGKEFRAMFAGDGLFRAPSDFGLADDPTLLIDQTAALQNYLNAAGTGRAMLPNWRIAFTQIKLRPGLTVEGAGVGPQFVNYGTYFRQLPGSNKSAIINDPTSAGPGAWHHWTKLSGFRLEKAAGDPDTLGSGIEFQTSPGEGMIIEWVFINRFPKNGIWLGDGAVPLKMRDLHLFNNGEYGLKLGNDTTKLWSSMYISTVSGDNNGLGLVHLLKLQSTNSTLLINHIKAEAASGAVQNCTIHIEDCKTPVEIHAINMLGQTPKVNEKIMVKITGQNTPRAVSVYGIAGSLVDTMVKDLKNNITIPWSPTRLALIYKDGVIHDVDPTDPAPVLGKPRVAGANTNNISHVVPVLSNGTQIGSIPMYTIASQPSGPLFADGFETNDTSQWTSTASNAGGSIAVSALATLAGSCGLIVTPSTTSANANVIRKVFKWRTPYLGGKLMVNLNTWASPSTRQNRIWRVGAANNVPVLFECYIDAGLSPKTCTMRCADDTNGFVKTSSFAIDTATHTLEFYIQRASSTIANDGIFRTWLDGVLKHEFLNLDLYDMEIPDTLEIGSNSGFTGFSGAFYLDGVVLSDVGRADASINP